MTDERFLLAAAQTSLGAALNRLAKWRQHFAGWQLGTRLKTDPESQAVRDHREATMLQRAELSALTRLLIEKGVFSQLEFIDQFATECAELEKLFEARWPGVRATEDGLTYDIKQIEQAGWMRNWKP